MRRLFVDCETSPNIGFFWKAGYKINVDYQNIIKERAIICICYKWEHEKIVKFLKWDEKQNDKGLIEKILPVLDEADEIVAQNGEAFDIPWIRTRAAFHGLVTNPHYKVIDTLLFARKRLYLNSNKLDYLASYFKIGHKIKTEFDLWKRITLDNHKPSLDKMIKYCKMDVILLEKVYHRLADHMASHSHKGVMSGGEKWSCPHCGSARVNSAHHMVTATGIIKHQMLCVACKKYYMISHAAHEARVNLRPSPKS